MDRVYLTRVYSDVKCDVHLEPENFLDTFKKLDEIEDKENFNVEFNTVQTDEKSHLDYMFEIYEKVK